MFKHSNKKDVIVAFVLGIIVAVFVGHAYVVYQVRGAVIQNQIDIAGVIQFLNTQIEAAQGAQGAQGFQGMEEGQF